MREGKRKFIKFLFYIISFFLFFRYLKPDLLKKKNRIEVPYSKIPANGAYILPDIKVAIIRNDSSLKVFSLICTHLGCTLSVTNRGFICPCHGSEFDFKGDVLKGPATKSLKKIKFKRKRNKIIIFI